MYGYRNNVKLYIVTTYKLQALDPQITYPVFYTCTYVYIATSMASKSGLDKGEHRPQHYTRIGIIRYPDVAVRVTHSAAAGILLFTP